MRIPVSSYTPKLIGPSATCLPWAASQFRQLRKRESARSRRSSSHSKKPTNPFPSAEELVVAPVDVRADPSHGLGPAVGEEQLGFAVLEEDPPLGIDEGLLIADEGRHPVRVVAIELPGHRDENGPFLARLHSSDFDGQHDASLALGASWLWR